MDRTSLIHFNIIFYYFNPFNFLQCPPWEIQGLPLLPTTWFFPPKDIHSSLHSITFSRFWLSYKVNYIFNLFHNVPMIWIDIFKVLYEIQNQYKIIMTHTMLYHIINRFQFRNKNSKFYHKILLFCDLKSQNNSEYYK